MLNPEDVRAKTILADALLKVIPSCDSCPVNKSCLNANSPEMFGTECTATIRSWAEARASEQLRPRANVRIIMPDNCAECVCLSKAVWEEGDGDYADRWVRVACNLGVKFIGFDTDRGETPPFIPKDCPWKIHPEIDLKFKE